MPYQPIAASDKFLGKSKLGLYRDIIMEIDWSVGQILDALESNDIDDNTFVIYASDNGPWLNYGKWVDPLVHLERGKVPCGRVERGYHV